MKSINKLFRHVPSWRLAKHFFQSSRLKSQSPEQIFSRHYRGNCWGGKGSVSGRGSDDDQTETIVDALPRLLADLGISTILDIPCGDFHWMKKVERGSVEYVGADVVAEIIARNRELFESDSTTFQQLDLISDPLPRADLVLCRDCLVHLSFEDIFASLENLCDSRAEYLLTTTFTKARENKDILTGEWRALNLERAPFHFPPPLKIINEGCSEEGGAFSDKSLGLWALADLPSCFNRL